MSQKIGVLVVDDSAVVRQVLGEVIKSQADMEFIGAAADPIFAMQKMQTVWPDVIVLDIEMPRMDGLTFLRKIMAERPTPVVICSSLAEHGTETAMQALASGAVEIITKPTLGLKGFLQSSVAEFANAIRAAAVARLHIRSPHSVAPVVAHVKTPIVEAMARTTDLITAIGTSTGGTQALETVLTQMEPDCAGIVIVQHMPEKFTAAFAKRLDSICRIDVREAADGDRVITGRALIAPGGRHLEIRRSGAQYIANVFRGPAVNRHCPSVDVLFRSVAKQAGANATGVIMTGMGDDGARGLKEMRDCGARTIAQDEASCVVFGMPKEAIKLGGVQHVVALAAIPALLAG